MKLKSGNSNSIMTRPVERMVRSASRMNGRPGGDPDHRCTSEHHPAVAVNGDSCASSQGGCSSDARVASIKIGETIGVSR
jgi:hypothetical protein